MGRAIAPRPTYPSIGPTTRRTTEAAGAPQANRSYTDIGQVIVGREYLGAWYKYWRTTTSTITSAALVIGSGDSTMEATSVPLARYTPAQLFPRIGLVRGFWTKFVNDGHSGKTTADWLATYLPAMLSTYAATPPNLIIMTWGRNDPPAGISVAQTIANIRQAVTTIRATWSADQTSLLWIGPNTAWDDANNRNEAWNEAVAVGLRQAARDLGFCLLDLYEMFREARYGLITNWLDATKLHANEDLYLQEYGAIADLCFPPVLQDLRAGPFAVTLVSGNPGGLGVSAAWPLAVYRRGMLNILKGQVSTFNASIAAGTSLFTVPAIAKSATGAFFKGRRLTVNGTPSAANTYDVNFYMDNAGLVKNLDPINEQPYNIYFDNVAWVTNIFDVSGNVFDQYLL